MVDEVKKCIADKNKAWTVCNPYFMRYSKDKGKSILEDDFEFLIYDICMNYGVYPPTSAEEIQHEMDSTNDDDENGDSITVTTFKGKWMTPFFKAILKKLTGNSLSFLS